MISFLLQEGVITVGTLSGIFTAGMLNSFRMNILDPTVENLVPSHKLDLSSSVSKLGEPGNVSVSNLAAVSPNTQVKWKTFLRDLLTWVFIMACLYIFWKTVLQKYKK